MVCVFTGSVDVIRNISLARALFSCFFEESTQRPPVTYLTPAN